MTMTTTAPAPCSKLTRAAALVAALLALPGLARAQGATNDAREHYRTAQDLFNSGKYRQAIEHLRQAYDLKPAPVVLRQIGHCYRKLGDAENAINSYRQYLAEAPSAPDRAEIEDVVRELEGVRDPAPAAPPPRRTARPEPPAEPPPDTESGAEEENPIDSALAQRVQDGGEEPPAGSKHWKWLKWTTLGLGVVATSVSFVFRGQASSAANDLEARAQSCADDIEEGVADDGCRYSQEDFDYESKIDQGNMLFGVSLGVGLASLAASGAFFYLDRKAQIEKSVEAEEEARLRLVPVVRSRGGGLFGEVRF